MNTTHKNSSIGTALLGSFLMLVLAATLSFGFVQTAHAQDDGGYYGGDYGSISPNYDYGGGGSYDYGYNGGCCDYGSVTPNYDYDYGSITPNYDYGTVTPNYDYGTVTPNYDYGTVTPNGGYSYVPDNYSYSSGSSFSLGGGYGGYGGYYGGYSYPYYSSYGGYGGGGYTNINTNSNYTYSYNSCVGTGNCNTVNTTITNPSPTVTYTSPSYSYPSYPSYSYSQPYSYTPPVIISASGTTNPYISLSSIPYTGLELGFWGTILYWGFLILWCLFAAYLIVVKRVHNKFVTFLFGKKVTEPAVAHTVHMPQQHQAAVRQNRSDDVAQALTTAPASFDAIDSFIMAQIQNRARA